MLKALVLGEREAVVIVEGLIVTEIPLDLE